MKHIHLKLFIVLIALLLGVGTMHSQRYAALREGLMPQIKATGWLDTFLQRQLTGMTGHPESLSYPYNTCLWAGEIERNTNAYGKNWWRYEQTAYYTDGLLRLGLLLGNAHLISKGEQGISYTIAHATPTGRLGNKSLGNNLWPITVFERAMMADYLYTRNPAIPRALERNFFSFDNEAVSGKNKVGHNRSVVSIEGMLWTYGITGNKKLLSLAERAWNGGDFELSERVMLSDKPLHLHGVTACEMLKLPALLYAYTGKQHYLDVALAGQAKLEREAVLPDGVPTSAEFVLGDDIDISHETCDIIDYAWTLGYFLEATGHARWADKIEHITFNALPGAVTKDFRSLQYFSSVNQVVATGKSNPNEFKYGSTWMAYRPTHETECCSGNVHRGMPNYVGRMWLTSATGALTAALYGPSQVTVGGLTVSEETSYPFSGTISFKMSGRARKQALKLRIPTWCHQWSLSLDGKPISANPDTLGFVTLTRKWQPGQVLTLSLAMDVVKHQLADGQGIYFTRGPLLLSYPVPTTVVADTVNYANMHGKVPGDSSFKCWSMTASAPWNYGVVSDVTATDLTTEPAATAYPLDHGSQNVQVQITAQPIAWTLKDGAINPATPRADEVQPLDGYPATTLTLVPYGSTELRVTVFPEIKK